MYHAKLWDEDKWNIHSSTYNPAKYGSIFKDDKKEEKKYHEQKYSPGEKDVSSDYIRPEDHRERDEKKSEDIFDSPDEEKKDLNIREEEIPIKAAKQVFAESIKERNKITKKKDVNSIEEAIKKAIEEEKKLIIMDS